MTERIDHAAEARMHIEWAHEHQEHEGITERTVTDTALLAQAEATLALVEQQRIANLVALSRIECENESTPTDAFDAIYDCEETNGWNAGVKMRTRPEIAAALGIEEVQS